MTQRFKPTALGAITSGVLLLAGCAQVDPAPDFRRTSELIAQQTDVAVDLDPALEDLVAGQIETMLGDGLSVREAEQIALLNNRGFAALFQELGLSRADIVQAGLLTNPSISLMFMLPEAGGRSNIQLNIGQELVDLWQIPIRRKIAETALDQTMLRIAQRAVELTAEARARYYEAVAARLLETTAIENVRLVEQSVKSAIGQLEAGEATLIDVNLQRAALIDANLSVLNIQRDRRIAEAELARVLGLNRSVTALTLTDPLPTPVPPPDEEILLRTALESRLDARLAQQDVLRARSELELEYLRIFPSVVAGLALERMERQALPGRNLAADTLRQSIASGALTAPDIESRAQRAAARRDMIDVILGPSIQITLPVWDQNQANIAKARYRIEQRRKEYENLLDSIALQLQRASATARTAATLARVYQDEALPQASETVEGARRVYESGEAAVPVLIEAQRSLLARRSAYVEVLRSYAVALSELQAAVGGRLPEAATTRPAVPDSQPVARAQRVEVRE